jgi:hypothetical protein
MSKARCRVSGYCRSDTPSFVVAAMPRCNLLCKSSSPRFCHRSWNNATPENTLRAGIRPHRADDAEPCPKSSLHRIPQVSSEMLDVFRGCVPGAHQASAAARADVRIKTPPEFI